MNMKRIKGEIEICEGKDCLHGWMVDDPRQLSPIDAGIILGMTWGMPLPEFTRYANSLNL